MNRLRPLSSCLTLLLLLAAARLSLSWREGEFGFGYQISLRFDFSEWGGDFRIVPPG